MSQHVVPSKVAYISLVVLYLEDAVPVDSSIFFLAYVISPILAPTLSASVSSHNPEKFLSPTLETFHDDLFTHASSIPGRNLWDLLLEKLWKINSLDAFHDLFHTLGNQIRRSRDQRLEDRVSAVPSSDALVLLSRRSPISLFLRRMFLEFDRLHLRDVVDLWRAFLKFRQPTMITWRRRNPYPQIANFDANLLSGDQTVRRFQTCKTNRAPGWDQSVSDIGSILEFQADRMQSEIAL